MSYVAICGSFYLLSIYVFFYRQDGSQIMSPGSLQIQSMHQPGVPARSSSLNRTIAGTNAATNNALIQMNDDVPAEIVAPLNPVSRVQIGQQDQNFSTPLPSDVTPVLEQQRPLDKPTLVKPQQRSSVHIQPGIVDANLPASANYAAGAPSIEHPPLHSVSNEASLRMSRQQPTQLVMELGPNHQMNYNNQGQTQIFYDQQQILHATPNHQQLISHQPPPMPVVVNHAPSPMITQSRRLSQTRNTNRNLPAVQTQHTGAISQHQTSDLSGIQTRQLPPSSPGKRTVSEVVPMNADKPTGLQLDEFLPRKFAGLGFNYNTNPGSSSKFSGYKNYGGIGEEMSESEVTSSILKGHDAMMAVLTTRGRNMEIIQKLWQGKDAKAGE